MLSKKCVPTAIVLFVLLIGSCTPAATPSPTPPPTPTTPALAEGQELITDVSLTQAVELTGQWRFRQVDMFSQDMTGPDYDDSGWKQTQAPAPWSEQGLGKLAGQSKVVVYRRQIQVPAGWAGKPVGISAWFNPHDSSVFVNGQRVEPARKPFAPYADVSGLLKYDQANTVVVTSIYEGLFEMSQAGPARLGLIEQRPVTQVIQEDVIIPAEVGEVDAALVRPAAGQAMPGLVLIATGSHGLGIKTEWLELASDLARQGYVSLAASLKGQRPEEAVAAVRYLRSQPFVNPARIVLVGADQSGAVVVTTAVQDPQIAGVVLISGPQVDEVAQLGSRPILFMAAEDDRRGLVLQQTQAMAKLVQGPSQVVALPGNGHGTFVLASAWNATRQALLAWLKQYLI